MKKKKKKKKKLLYATPFDVIHISVFKMLVDDGKKKLNFGDVFKLKELTLG